MEIYPSFRKTGSPAPRGGPNWSSAATWKRPTLTPPHQPGPANPFPLGGGLRHPALGFSRIARQAKGMQFRVERGRWYLIIPISDQKVSTPAMQTRHSALQLTDFLYEWVCDMRNPFGNSIPAFVGVEPGTGIEA